MRASQFQPGGQRGHLDQWPDGRTDGRVARGRKEGRKSEWVHGWSHCQSDRPRGDRSRHGCMQAGHSNECPLPTIRGFCKWASFGGPYYNLTGFGCIGRTYAQTRLSLSSSRRRRSLGRTIKTPSPSPSVFLPGSGPAATHTAGPVVTL